MNINFEIYACTKRDKKINRTKERSHALQEINENVPSGQDPT